MEKIRIISREEVLRHNTSDDCWLIICNKVYNVTPFLQKHPGGSDLLLSRAGEDATSFFMTKHSHDKHAVNLLKSYEIGELPVTQQIPESVFQEPFILELLNKISENNLFRVDKSTERRFFHIRTMAVTLFFICSLIAIYFTETWWVSIIAVTAQAFVATSLFGLIAHEATHRRYPYQLVLQKALKIVWPVFWPFISQKPLYYEHNSHHFKIGDPEYDFEVAGFSRFIRYSGKVEHRTIHRIQHRIAFMLYPFYANIITTYGGAVSNFWSKHNRNVTWQHGWSLLASISYYILIPAIITGEWWWCLLLYFIYQSLLFYGIYVGAAINHFTLHALNPIPEDKANLYGYYVCHNTTNFRTFHPFWFWYTGGFNVQIEHHLVPYIPVENLHKLVPIVKMLCEKYNYPYKEFKRFSCLWNNHYSYLKELSNERYTDSILVEMNNKRSYQPR